MNFKNSFVHLIVFLVPTQKSLSALRGLLTLFYSPFDVFSICRVYNFCSYWLPKIELNGVPRNFTINTPLTEVLLSLTLVAHLILIKPVLLIRVFNWQFICDFWEKCKKKYRVLILHKMNSHTVLAPVTDALE